MVTTKKQIHPVIDRTHGSESTNPDIAIASTPIGHESLYLGPLTSKDGKTAYLRVSRSGYRVLLKNSHGRWTPVPEVTNLEGESHGTAGVGDLVQLGFRLERNDFHLDEDSKAFFDQLPKSSAVAHTVVTTHRSQIAAEYLAPEIQAL